MNPLTTKPRRCTTPQCCCASFAAWSRAMQPMPAGATSSWILASRCTTPSSSGSGWALRTPLCLLHSQNDLELGVSSEASESKSWSTSEQKPSQSTRQDPRLHYTCPPFVLTPRCCQPVLRRLLAQDTEEAWMQLGCHLQVAMQRATTPRHPRTHIPHHPLHDSCDPRPPKKRKLQDGGGLLQWSPLTKSTLCELVRQVELDREFAPLENRRWTTKDAWALMSKKDQRAALPHFKGPPAPLPPVVASVSSTPPKNFV